MSLINKMLRDIESRQEQAPPASRPEPAKPIPVKPVYHDLRPAMHASGKSRRPALVLAGVAVAAVVASVYYFGQRASFSEAPQARDQRTPAPVATTERIEPVEASLVAAAPAQAAAPAPKSETIVAAPPPAAQPVPAADLPVTARVSPPATVPVVAPPPVATAPQPSTPPAKPVTQNPAVAGDTKVRTARVAPPVETGAIDKRVRPLTPEEKAETLYRQAVRSLEQGRGGDAGRQLYQALSADPQHVHARELQVALALKNGRTREAQQLLDEGIRLAPKHYPFVQLLARIHVEQGAEAQALALLEQAAPMAASDADYMSLLAALYQRQGRHADAVAAYRRAAEIRPDDARTWVGLGISLEMEKDNEAARLSYQRARDLGNLPLALSRHANQRLAELSATN